MSIYTSKKPEISNTYEDNNYHKPFILHEKHNNFYSHRVWKWIDGEWLFVIDTSKEKGVK